MIIVTIGNAIIAGALSSDPRQNTRALARAIRRYLQLKGIRLTDDPDDETLVDAILMGHTTMVSPQTIVDQLKLDAINATYTVVTSAPGALYLIEPRNLQIAT